MVKRLLVIECTEDYNWYERFANVKLHGKEEIIVEQAAWQDISIVCYPSNGAIVSIRRAKNPLPGTSQSFDRTVNIDFVLLRSVSRGIANQDSRHLLLGLIHQNIPSVNSLISAYLCCERPTTYGALLEIQNRVGAQNFPLIEQTYYSNFREMLISPDAPFVCKVGHAQSGYGKFRITNTNDFGDFRSVCALHNDYVTAEPFIRWDWDGRVQKIGCHYRAFKRTSSNWKGNVGNQSVVQEIEVEDEWKMWADECSKIFGGLDILGLDFVHSADTGKYHILEVNDTAIGLVHAVANEDMEHMKNLVIMRMEQHFPDCEDESKIAINRANDNDNEKLKSANEEIAQLKLLLQNQKMKIEEQEDTIQSLLSDNDKKKKNWKIW